MPKTHRNGGWIKWCPELGIYQSVPQAGCSVRHYTQAEYDAVPMCPDTRATQQQLLAFCREHPNERIEY
jgi:hypothetical protein